jgi:hypothetical protein
VESLRFRESVAHLAGGGIGVEYKLKSWRSSGSGLTFFFRTPSSPSGAAHESDSEPSQQRVPVARTDRLLGHVLLDATGVRHIGSCCTF